MKELLDLIFHNWHYKLLAFLFAVLLWYAAANKEIATSEVRVNLILVPSGEYEVVDYSPKTVILTVKGYRKAIYSLRENNVVKYLLPKNLPFGVKERVIFLKKDNFLLPYPSIKIKSFFPEVIRVKLEKLVGKAVPVKLEAVGIPPKTKVELVPNYVVVMVPKGKEGKVHYVKTRKVDLSAMRGKGVVYVKLEDKKVKPELIKVILKKR